MVHVLEIHDGHEPSIDVVKKFIRLLKEIFGNEAKDEKPTKAIGVHCVAGLGRYDIAITSDAMKWK